NGTLFFTAFDPVNGQELWKSDGTTAGTALVKDIRPGSMSAFVDSDEYPFNPFLTAVGGTLFFTADDGTSGAELWKRDGTAAGTVLVKAIVPGGGSSGPQRLTNVSGTLYFMAWTAEAGYELWKSDGTAAGTILVKDIRPGNIGSLPFGLTNVGG